jgi:ABC-2 type transport system ATP-binding protein
MSETSALRIEHARKEYRTLSGERRTAVADVTLDVARGSIHGLLGPNGAGKTTTLKMLLGLVRPSGGSFEILGQKASTPGAKSSLGFLPEQPYFSPQLTALETMTLYGRLSGMSRREVMESAAQRLERVGLAGREKTLLSKFSRGMLQRLGIALSLLGSPAVLVLDEPASGLDPVGQRDVRNLMLELRSLGATLLLSSHQLSEVEAVCDGVTILNRGHVAAKGHIDDLLNVAGRTSVRAVGEGRMLPLPVAALAEDVATSSGTWIFSVADDN